MEDSFSSGSVVMASIAIGYLIGAIPLADRVSQRRGVDIFAEGTGLAGAANVRKQIGRGSAALVVLGDIAKGALSIVVARLLGVEGSWMLLPAAAAVMGHWKSVFSGFRGGDGMATLGGVIIALFPMAGLISAAVAIAVATGGQRMPYTSLLNLVAGYGTLVAINLTYGVEPTTTAGIGILSVLVLGRAALGHKRRHSAA